mmetsp:Transcript_4219/g.10538  ORF Transcript_4219/g.10538 Transcript_4219/m.10538 type:complete len:265 (+) Transcript_4219:1833-2627(+)
MTSLTRHNAPSCNAACRQMHTTTAGAGAPHRISARLRNCPPSKRTTTIKAPPVVINAFYDSKTCSNDFQRLHKLRKNGYNTTSTPRVTKPAPCQPRPGLITTTTTTSTTAAFQELPPANPLHPSSSTDASRWGHAKPPGTGGTDKPSCLPLPTSQFSTPQAAVTQKNGTARPLHSVHITAHLTSPVSLSSNYTHPTAGAHSTPCTAAAQNLTAGRPMHAGQCTKTCTLLVVQGSHSACPRAGQGQQLGASHIISCTSYSYHVGR